MGFPGGQLGLPVLHVALSYMAHPMGCSSWLLSHARTQLTLQQEGLGFRLVPPFPLTKLPRRAHSHAPCRGWKKRSSHRALALRAAPNWRNWAEPGCCPRVFRAVSPCCPLASPSPPLSQLFTSGFCFLDLLLCMRHVEGAPANIGHTLIVQQAGK